MSESTNSQSPAGNAVRTGSSSAQGSAEPAAMLLPAGPRLLRDVANPQLDYLQEGQLVVHRAVMRLIAAIKHEHVELGHGGEAGSCSHVICTEALAVLEEISKIGKAPQEAA